MGTADLTFINGSIWTGNSRQPWAEALAIRGDRIRRVGSTPDVKNWTARGARTVDLEGGLVLPGFIDCHTHFIRGGFGLRSIQLGDATSREEFVSRIRAEAEELEEGEWILGGNWDHEQFNPPELPGRDWIDAVTPGNPVCVSRLDGHMVLVNSLALGIAGINRDTPVPAGGEISTDPATGEPVGILKDAAMRLVYSHIPEPSFQDRLRAAELALNHAAENGVTSVHDMSEASSFEVYKELARQRRLTTRVTLYIPITEVDATGLQETTWPSGGDLLKLGGLKGFVDGSLGSSTACFFEPYTDDPGTRGLLHAQMFPEGVMEERIFKADRAGLQVAIHAIGDRANSLLLDIYARVESLNGRRDRRWRIEHAQHLRPEDMVRMGKLGIIGSVQPYHLTDDGCWAQRKIGEDRARTTYAFRSLLDSGVTLAFGSDWTVAPLDPLAGIHAAVTRRTRDGKNPGGWVPAEKITVEEAVRAYSAGGAYAEFSELSKGTVEERKLADLVVLDRNIFEIPPEQLSATRVKMTVTGGEVVHEK